ncbi:hypothetical protein Tco_0397682 [Tanacetum coccineum]
MRISPRLRKNKRCSDAITMSYTPNAHIAPLYVVKPHRVLQLSVVCYGGNDITPTVGYEDAIVVPEITADNFDLKHGLLTLVQNKQFFGHDKEDPHAHIRYFNKITSTMKFPNVPSTSVKLMLFPFSLVVQPDLD